MSTPTPYREVALSFEACMEIRAMYDRLSMDETRFIYGAQNPVALELARIQLMESWRSFTWVLVRTLSFGSGRCTVRRDGELQLIRTEEEGMTIGAVPSDHQPNSTRPISWSLHS